MKKKILILLIFTFFIPLCGFSAKNEEGGIITDGLTLGSNVKEILNIKKDITAPKLKVTDDSLDIKKIKDDDGEHYQLIQPLNTQINIPEYFSASDDSGNCQLLSFGKIDVTKEGNYELLVIATDDSLNATSAKLKVKIMSKEDYQKKHDKRAKEKEEAERLARQEAIAKENAAKAEARLAQANSLSNIPSNSSLSVTANAMVGMPGDCFYMATALMQKVYGPNVSLSNRYAISASEAQPGDIIFYANGGLGTTHWAVYLGGTTAFHGNWNGRAKIGSVYLNSGSAPQFYRVNK